MLHSVSEVGFNEYWSMMDVMLQLILNQFKELKSEISTNTAQLKSDMGKFDMSKIRADLITQVHVIENKIGNYISVIREELETQIGDVHWPNSTQREAW